MLRTNGLFPGLVILATALLLTGCSLTDRVRGFLSPDDTGTAVVRVGSKEFSQADLQRFFDSRLSDFRDPAKADQVKSNLLESFVEEKLLLHQADRFQIEPTPEALGGILEETSERGSERSLGSARRDTELEQNLADSLKMQRYLNEYLLSEVTVSEAECEAYYRDHIGDYVRNDVLHVGEILVDDLSEAEKILASLKENRNKNFVELARVYSKAASASDGGDLGTFQRGELPEEFEKVIFPLPPGAVSKIVKSKYGYHIFLVEEKILAHQQKFYEVRDQIRARLSLEREREIINKEVEFLMNRIPVEIHQSKLGFTYIGTRFSARGSK